LSLRLRAGQIRLGLCIALALILGTAPVFPDVASASPRVLRVPSGRYPTIADAIHAAPNGATIRIARGVYNESIEIDHKSLAIIGTTSRHKARTVLAGDSASGPIVSYGVGGGGTLANVTLHGATVRTGIEGGPDDRTLPAALHLRRIRAFGLDRAVSGYFNRLSITHARIGPTTKSGLVISSVRMLLKESTVVDSMNAGYLVFNTQPGNTTIHDDELDDNARGGIYVIGHSGSVAIKDTKVEGNGEAGITLLDADGTTIQKSAATFTKELSHAYGDGIRAIASTGVKIVGASSSWNDRSGISVYGCALAEQPSAVAFANNYMGYNPFPGDVGHIDIDVESDQVASTIDAAAQTVDFTLTDCPVHSANDYQLSDGMGNNCPDTTHPNHACEATSSEMGPPPPMGGLQ
jgi:hypothetical protein